MIREIDFLVEHQTKGLLILSSNGQFYGSSMTLDDLFDCLCESNGRSVQGSMALFAKVNQAHQKIGILVNPEKREIFFPTHARNNPDCIWINYRHVKKIQSAPFGRCLVHFYKSELELNCSIKVIRAQMKRCEHLLNTIVDPYFIINEQLTHL